jgi:RNA polymerase-binding transcription factor DksA
MANKRPNRKRGFSRKRIVKKYSADQLREFRNAILGLREAALNDVKSIKETYATPVAEGDNGTHDSEVDFAERSYRGSLLAENAQLIERQLQLIARLEAALKRINNGGYGTCKSCGRLIDRMRLLAVPHTQECMTCKSAKAGFSAGMHRIH